MSVSFDFFRSRTSPQWPRGRGVSGHCGEVPIILGGGKAVMLHQFWREREDNFLTRAHNIND